jgi:hypothetical protein
VWLVAATIVIAILVVVVTRGRFSELVRLRIRAPWLLLAGLAIQIAVDIVDFPRDQIETLGYGLLMASYALILAFCFVNITKHGFGIIAVGVALNALVIGLNQGMPTKALREDAHGRPVEKPIEQTVKHRPERDSDLLPVLGDRIVLPAPIDTVVSIGDLVMLVGVVELVYFGSRRRRRRRARRGQTTSRPRRTATRSSASSTRPS